MTLRAPAQGEHGRRAPGPSHPPQRLGADEVRLARTVLAEHGLVGQHTRFVYLVHLIDQELLPVPEEEGNFDDPAAVGPARASLKPIRITQPEGPSFTVDGAEVAWAGWRLRIGFDAREGLTLRRPGPGQVLAELLRPRRVPPRPAGRLPDARL